MRLQYIRTVYSQRKQLPLCFLTLPCDKFPSELQLEMREKNIGEKKSAVWKTGKKEEGWNGRGEEKRRDERGKVEKFKEQRGNFYHLIILLILTTSLSAYRLTVFTYSV